MHIYRSLSGGMRWNGDGATSGRRRDAPRARPKADQISAAVDGALITGTGYCLMETF